MNVSYEYQPLNGPLPGASFEEQTRAFLRDAASRAEWGNVRGKPDLESWQAGVDDRLNGLDGLAAANGQGVQTALSGMTANADAIVTLLEKAAVALAERASLRVRLDLAERNEAAVQNRVGDLEQEDAARQADIAALQTRVEDGESELAAARDEAAAAVQTAAGAYSVAYAHRERHAVDGPDALDPADIGAAPAARGVPVGLVGLWNGENVPEGWAECDGAGGTPDLSGYAAGTLHYIQFRG